MDFDAVLESVLVAYRTYPRRTPLLDAPPTQLNIPFSTAHSSMLKGFRLQIPLSSLLSYTINTPANLLSTGMTQPGEADSSAGRGSKCSKNEGGGCSTWRRNNHSAV